MSKMLVLIIGMTQALTLSAQFVAAQSGGVNNSVIMLDFARLAGKLSSCFSSWRSVNNDPCVDQWSGVSCDATKTMVIQLRLTHCGLTGRLDPGLARMTSLHI